jgi:hypothetical protein
MRWASGPSFTSALGVRRVKRKVKGDEGTVVTRDGVVWAAAGRLSLRFVVGLMSVKPRRKPDEGGPMVAWTLLGCISDMGGLIGDEPPGVLGARTGDETTASCFCAWPFAGVSSHSATDERLGASVVGLGA